MNLQTNKPVSVNNIRMHFVRVHNELKECFADYLQKHLKTLNNKTCNNKI